MARNTKKPVDLETLHKRLSDQERLVADLRVQQTDAILADEKFDIAKLRTAIEEMHALEEAVAEFKRREEDRAIAEAEAAQAASAEERLEKRIADIRSMAVRREQAIQDAETAARAFTDAVLRAENERQTLQAALHSLTGKVPSCLMPGGQEDRLSKSFSAVLSEALRKGSYGDLKLRPGLKTADQSWLASEMEAARDIEAALLSLEGEEA